MWVMIRKERNQKENTILILPWPKTMKDRRLVFQITQAYLIANTPTQIHSPSTIALRVMKFGKLKRYRQCDKNQTVLVSTLKYFYKGVPQ